jgi:hypothetical protein
MLAIHLLWINLVTDSAFPRSAWPRSIDGDVMKQRRADRNERSTDGDCLGTMFHDRHFDPSAYRLGV